MPQPENSPADGEEESSDRRSLSDPGDRLRSSADEPSSAAGGPDGSAESPADPAEIIPHGSQLSLPSSGVLTRYIGGEVLKIFLFVLTLIEFGYALMVSVVVSRRFDLDLLIVMPVMWRTALSMLNDSMPIALLFASGLVYGRFVADREIDALKSFGLSATQLLRPVVVIGGFGIVVGIVVVGFLAPEMNYAKSNVTNLISDQLRYLGEGWNRNFPFGNYHLWVTHYNGRELSDITLRPQSSKTILPKDVSQQAADSFFIYAERARVLFPEELAQIAADDALNGGAEVDPTLLKYPPGTIVFRLQNVRVFFSGEFIGQRDPSGFMHKVDLDVWDFPYNPSELVPTARRTKQLSFPKLWQKIRAARKSLAERPDDPHRQREASEVVTEFHWRLARISAFFLYPVLAGLLGLLLNAGNRYVPFFAAAIVAPSIFYGMGSVGQMLGRSGMPAWAAMAVGPGVLTAIVVTGCIRLERRAR
ncbi:MAG: LptF/LptG family permease [Planctomycetota bacterium]